MIPKLVYLVGLLPILVLIVPNSRKLRLHLAVVTIILLWWFWSGVSHVQALEDDDMRMTVEDFADRIATGEQDAVCDAIITYARLHGNKPFNGMLFVQHMERELKEPERKEIERGEREWMKKRLRLRRARRTADPSASE
jgi:hypothetical protein